METATNAVLAAEHRRSKRLREPVTPERQRARNMRHRHQLEIRRLGLTIFCAVLVSCAHQGSRPAPSVSDEELSAIAGSVSPRDLKVGEMMFTTRAYHQEALRLVLAEANDAARQLNLPEKLPITESDLERVFIGPYGMSRMFPRPIGTVHTRQYGYFVSIDHKLSYIMHARYDEACIKWRAEYTWPISRLDTNGAYQLATQWLAAVSMDVEGLNRDCEVFIRPNEYWNAGLKRGMFVPIYEVSWRSPQNIAERFGNVARVSLFAPTQTLISLNVREPKYILRDRLVFTNLAELLSQPATQSEDVEE
jgi:hypothetical protein